MLIWAKNRHISFFCESLRWCWNFIFPPTSEKKIKFTLELHGFEEEKSTKKELSEIVQVAPSLRLRCHIAVRWFTTSTSATATATDLGHATSTVVRCGTTTHPSHTLNLSHKTTVVRCGPTTHLVGSNLGPTTHPSHRHRDVVTVNLRPSSLLRADCDHLAMSKTCELPGCKIEVEEGEGRKCSR